MMTNSTRTNALLALFGAVLPLSTGFANEIRYRCGGLGEVVVVDGAGVDLDIAPNKIRVAIDCIVPAGPGVWRATGVLVADGSDPNEATTSFESLTIRNLAGNVLAQMFWAEHRYSFAQDPETDVSASIAGHFDNVLAPGWVHGAMLNASVNVVHGTALFTTLVMAMGTPFVMGASPIPFDGAGGPVTVAHPSRHRIDLFFYLDSPGDAIIIAAGDDEGIDVGNSAPAPCVADLDLSGDVGFGDLVALLLAWGPCAGCPEDIDESGNVGFGDITELLLAWGPCD